MNARGRRGSAFTELKDVAVTKAWIAASEDAHSGADQKGYVHRALPQILPFRRLIEN